jgi:rare lipoprotein A
MGRFWGTSGFDRTMRIAALVSGCLALANCANSNSASRVDPRYGVASSERVIAPGEPVPKGGGVYRVCNPYVVAGRTYVPREDINYSATGLASWYGDDFHGRYTANGEIFDMNSISAAHPTLPLPSYVRVTNLRNHKSIVVRVNDRGPYANDRIIDLSVRTAKLLGFYGEGLARVKVDYVGRAPLVGSDDRKLMATLRDGSPAPASSVMVASADPYVPTYFDGRKIANVPPPPDRPFRLGEGAHEVPVVTVSARTSVERHPLTAVASAAPPRARPAEPADEPLTSPVSAYAPVRYDNNAGFMSGRGLY